MNQIVVARAAASNSRQTGEDRAHIAASMANAKTRLAAAQIVTKEIEPDCLLVDEAFVFWPGNGFWRHPDNRRGYGIGRLITAVQAPTVIAAARAE